MKPTDGIKEYLLGKRKGKAANRLERQSLSDPFLYEALEGYTGYSGNPVDALNQLQQKIQQQGDPHSNLKRNLKILAVIVLIAGGIGILWLNKNTIRDFMKPEEAITESPVLNGIPRQPTTFDTTKPNRDKQQATQEEITPEEEFDGLQPPPEENEKAGQSLTHIQSSIRVDSIGRASLPVCGLKAYSRYIDNALKYQEEDIANRAQGEIIVTFTINTDGFPSQIRIEKGFSQTVNQDIIRLLSSGSQWSPISSDRKTRVSIFIRYIQ